MPARAAARTGAESTEPRDTFDIDDLTARFLERPVVMAVTGAETQCRNCQRSRLATYMVQAQFSLAAIYDRAASNVDFDPDSVVAEERP